MAFDCISEENMRLPNPPPSPYGRTTDSFAPDRNVSGRFSRGQLSDCYGYDLHASICYIALAVAAIFNAND